MRRTSNCSHFALITCIKGLSSGLLCVVQICQATNASVYPTCWDQLGSPQNENRGSTKDDKLLVFHLNTRYGVVESTIGAQQKHPVYAPSTVGLLGDQFPTRGINELRRSHKKGVARYRSDADRRCHSTRQCQIAPSPKIKVQLFRVQPRSDTNVLKASSNRNNGLAKEPLVTAGRDHYQWMTLF